MAEENAGTGTDNTGGTPAATHWYDGIDAEITDHFRNRGLLNGDARNAAVEMARSHRAAEALIGVPADRVLRLPADPNDAAAMDAVYTRLGRPAKAEEYNFGEVKYASGDKLGDDFTGRARNLAFALNLPPAQAQRMVSEIVKWSDAEDAREAQEAQVAQKEAEDRLKANWGANYDANLFIAKNAAQRLGISAEAVDALTKLNGVGYDKVLEMFRDLGVRLGEDKFVTTQDGKGGGNTVMTKEQAFDKYFELTSDADFTSKYLNGDGAAKRELEGLFNFFTASELQAERSKRRG